MSGGVLIITLAMTDASLSDFVVPNTCAHRERERGDWKRHCNYKINIWHD